MAQNLRTRYTCPTIDSSISDIEVEFKDILFHLIDEVAPQTSDTFVKDYIDSSWESFKECVTDSFEEVRTTNENLRSEAEEIIDDLKDEVSDLLDRVDNLTDDIEQLESKLSEQD